VPYGNPSKHHTPSVANARKAAAFIVAEITRNRMTIAPVWELA